MPEDYDGAVYIPPVTSSIVMVLAADTLDFPFPVVVQTRISSARLITTGGTPTSPFSGRLLACVSNRV